MVEKLKLKTLCNLCGASSNHVYAFLFKHKNGQANLCRKCAANITKQFLQYIQSNEG